MIIEQVDGFVTAFTVVRITTLVLSVGVLVGALIRLPLWLDNPPPHVRLLGLLTFLVPLTVIVNAIDQYLRGVDPGAATLGTLIVMIILGGLLIVRPENDGRPSRSLRGLERLGVRFRASRQSRR